MKTFLVPFEIMRTTMIAGVGRGSVLRGRQADLMSSCTNNMSELRSGYRTCFVTGRIDSAVFVHLMFKPTMKGSLVTSCLE